MECPKCEATEFDMVDELESAGSPYGTGYRVLVCAVCGEPVPDDGTTDTRVWVGF